MRSTAVLQLLPKPGPEKVLIYESHHVIGGGIKLLKGFLLEFGEHLPHVRMRQLLDFTINGFTMNKL